MFLYVHLRVLNNLKHGTSGGRPLNFTWTKLYEQIGWKSVAIDNLLIAIIASNS